MIKELALRYEQKTGKVYDVKNRHIQYANCLIPLR